MQNFIAALIFLSIYVVSLYGAYWLKAKYMPLGLTTSRVLLRVIGFGLAFLGILCLMLWGLNPTIVAIGAQMSLNPLRWFWWVIAAILLGLSEGFISDARNQKLVAKAKQKSPLPPTTPKVPADTDV